MSSLPSVLRGSCRSAVRRGTAWQNQAERGGAGPACRGGRAGSGGQVVGLAALLVDQDQLRWRCPRRAHHRRVVRRPGHGRAARPAGLRVAEHRRIGPGALPGNCRGERSGRPDDRRMGQQPVGPAGNPLLDRPGQRPRRGRFHLHRRALLQRRGLLHHRLHAAIPAGRRIPGRAGGQAPGRGREPTAACARSRAIAGADPEPVTFRGPSTRSTPRPTGRTGSTVVMASSLSRCAGPGSPRPPGPRPPRPRSARTHRRYGRGP